MLIFIEIAALIVSIAQLLGSSPNHATVLSRNGSAGNDSPQLSSPGGAYLTYAACEGLRRYSERSPPRTSVLDYRLFCSFGTGLIHTTSASGLIGTRSRCPEAQPPGTGISMQAS